MRQVIIFAVRLLLLQLWQTGFILMWVLLSISVPGAGIILMVNGWCDASAVKYVMVVGLLLVSYPYVFSVPGTYNKLFIFILAIRFPAKRYVELQAFARSGRRQFGVLGASRSSSWRGPANFSSTFVSARFGACVACLNLFQVDRDCTPIVRARHLARPAARQREQQCVKYSGLFQQKKKELIYIL